MLVVLVWDPLILSLVIYLQKHTKILIYHFFIKKFKFEFALSSLLRLCSISKMKEMEKDVSPDYVFCLRHDIQKALETVISHGLKFSQKRSALSSYVTPKSTSASSPTTEILDFVPNYICNSRI